MSQRRPTHIEVVHIEEKFVSGSDRAAVQMGRSDHEGTWPIGQAARRRAFRRRPRFKQMPICRGGSGITQQHAENAANHVGALARGKPHRVRGPKMETESLELECAHGLACYLLYNGMAFDS